MRHRRLAACSGAHSVGLAVRAVWHPRMFQIADDAVAPAWDGAEPSRQPHAAVIQDTLPVATGCHVAGGGPDFPRRNQVRHFCPEAGR